MMVVLLVGWQCLLPGTYEQTRSATRHWQDNSQVSVITVTAT